MEGLISFESIAEVILDVISNERKVVVSKYLDEEGKDLEKEKVQSKWLFIFRKLEVDPLGGW